ncbi:hypothetical protein ABZ172_01535 [Streptomyces sp. NPDC006296]|uniref:hypothetical protein n=1 Tax=Streptomyces sp. NPDC006296 TaxID=3156746 RepID=UPI0033A5ABF4
MDSGAAQRSAPGRRPVKGGRTGTGGRRRWWSRCAVLAAAAVSAALLTAPTAQAARAAEPAPCPQLPCEGADPGKVTAWQSGGAPKVFKETTLASGTRIVQYTGKPAWDTSSGRTYTWAEVHFGSGVENGRLWLRAVDNWGDGINIITPVDHPRAYRGTDGTTGMFLYSTSVPRGTYANSACVSDGTERGCLTEYSAEVVPWGPCEGWCAEADPKAIPASDWSYVERSDYHRVELPSGASVQQASGRLKQGGYLGWAEGVLPAGGRYWLEAWQGSGRWGEVYSELPRDGASRTATGSTRAFSWLPELRACVSDSTGTECTTDGEDMATPPAQAPCATLPCTGIDPASVTEWMPLYDPEVVEDADIYQGGRLKIYKGRPAWDPYHFYYWGEAELPPGRDGVSATLMKHASGGPDSRTARPEPLPGGRLTASGKTKMIALDPLSGDQIAGLVADGKKWAFATHQGNNIYQTSVQGPIGPCAPGEACEGVTPDKVTTWSSKATDWDTAELPNGARVTLSGGRPDWSVSDDYAWAHSASSGVTVWLEDKQPGGTYAKVADAGVLKATDGRRVRACLSDGTTTRCTTPVS